MLHRRSLLALPFALGLAAITTTTWAGEAKPFTQATFEAAKASGKPVLVEVTAPWCPVCKAQKPILSDLKAQSKFKDMAVFEVDFDSQKDALRALNVQKQSTLITYKGGQEVGRSTGDTSKASISDLLNKAI